jgi:ComF family protein
MGKVLLQAKSTELEADLAGAFQQGQSVKLRNTVLLNPQRRIIAEACVLCDRRAESERICQPCRRILPWNNSFCECCGQAVPAGQPAGVICATCQTSRPCFERARAPLIYDFPVDAVIKAIKFKRQLWFVPAFAELLLGSLKDEFAEVDALVPVPLHRWRQMRRGFNQAAELCRPLHNATGLPIVNEAVRIRATGTQTGLNAAERKRNLRNAFAMSGKLKSRRPLIVDDVITTGETCSQLAMTLKEAGAKSVNVLTVARAEGNRP